MEKYGRYPFIRFGEVLGKQAVFLIQNICPATNRYIREIYTDKNNIAIKIDNRVVQDVISNARDVLARVNRGAKLVFTDIASIKQTLLAELENTTKSGIFIMYTF